MERRTANARRKVVVVVAMILLSIIDHSLTQQPDATARLDFHQRLTPYLQFTDYDALLYASVFNCRFPWASVH